MKEIIIIIIINKRFVRWEIMNENATFNNLHELLDKKYKLLKYVIEIDNIFIQKKIFHHKIIDYSYDNEGATIMISTKEKYKLSSDIF